MDKERREHFRPVHHAEEFGLVAKLHEVIRSWCRRAGQLILHSATALDDLRSCLAVVVFQN